LLRVEEGGEPKTAPVTFTRSEVGNLLELAQGRSNLYMRSVDGGVAKLPSYAYTGAILPACAIWYEGGEIKFSNGSTVITLGSTGGGGGGADSGTSGSGAVGRCNVTTIIRN